MPRIPQDWIDDAARCLYEAKRLAQPELELPHWGAETGDVKRECRYLAEGAYQRSLVSVHGMAVQRVAMTLAMAEGYVWPEMDNKVDRRMQIEEAAAIVAEKRQRFIHVARLVVGELNKYTDVQAKHEHEEWRDSTLKAARAQAITDRETVETWRVLREQAVKR